MKLLKELDEALKEYVRPLTMPVAVKLLKEEKFPEKTRRPVETLGHPIALCQGIGIVRKYGWSLGFKKEDHACAPSLSYFGIIERTQEQERGGIVYPLYAKTMEAGKISEEITERLDKGFIDGILLSPLNKAAFAPDVVIVYGNAGQVVRMVQGAVYCEGGGIETTISGRCACVSEIIAPFKKQKCNVIIPGGGEKIFAATADDELAFAVPYARIPELIEGIATTHKSGVARYPFPVNGLKARPVFPDRYAELEEAAGLRSQKD